MLIINKRGMTLWEVVIWAIILLIVAAIIIFTFRNLFGKEILTLGKELSATGDQDGDLVADRFDKCICISGEAGTGCPVGNVPSTQAERFTGCTKSFCQEWGITDNAILNACKG